MGTDDAPAIGLLPALAVTLAAALWGVFWVPLRGLHAAGLSPGWATTLAYVAPLVALAPFAAPRWRRFRDGGRGLSWTGAVAGTSFVLYADALILTEVVRALLLFYLTPVWSTLLERVLMGVPIRGVRWVTIVLGFAGLAVILGVDAGVPLPRNAGDWMGLASGMLWAWAAVRIRRAGRSTAFELTFSYLVWGSVASILIALLLLDGTTGLPRAETLREVAPWFLPVALLVILPATYLVMWGAKRLSPGVIGILFMSEISVGTVTAALWAGEPFGPRELAGVVLVTAAGAIEVADPAIRRAIRRGRAGTGARIGE